MGPPLPPTPAALRQDVAARFGDRFGADDPIGRRWSTTDELLAGDAATLRATHGVLVADGAPGGVASMFLIGWSVGIVAEVLGFVLGTARVGLVPRPDQIRLLLHPGGWAEGVDVGSSCGLVVTPDHPYASHPNAAGGEHDDDDDGVLVVPTEAEVARRTVDALLAVVAPFVDACRSFARVGRPGLYNELVDRFALAVTYDPGLGVDADDAARLVRAVTRRGAPWSARPALWPADLDGRSVIIGQKGGCCLEYKLALDDTVPDPALLSASQRAYRERFPDAPGAPRYCSTCSLRTAADVEARRLFWLRINQ